MSDPEDRSMPTICMHTNYKEIRKEVPERAEDGYNEGYEVLDELLDGLSRKE